MNELLTAISTGMTAFTATNLDDILILLLFFSQVNAVFRRRHIVFGQFLGFSALVLVSIPGFFGRLIFPPDWIGMLGLLPIAIGLSRLLNPETDDSEAEAELEQSENSFFRNFLSPQTYSVAGVTVANGGDNIGIYVPLFASNTLESLAVILAVFFAMVGVWCYAAYRLIQMRAIADTLTRYGNQLVPFVLIGLGMAILVKSGTLASPTLSIISLVGCGFCLITMSRSNASETEV
ncbi:cadmium resistance transporter [Oscillatoria nigro-viridis PCC 7112]|uniref:Cadmium resistance transporter n=1 Tax=Phormidium nigroviride PCC 7112 TaxID=179408 RepID=K9VN07_9CYAN|nr:cadmium resistance transporter [Oscillatoria nigro-viridis]AFZ08939.1 cadmium resistance transporter [Oscillatoria nigro-viridis PCC 7112]